MPTSFVVLRYYLLRTSFPKGYDLMNNASPLLQSKWKQVAIQSDLGLYAAMRVLDELASQILLVVGENNVLLGTITDGDLRRAIMKGLDENTHVSALMNANPFVVKVNDDRQHIISKMRLNKIHQMPVVNDNYELQGLHFWDEISASPKYDNLVVLMAGGFGKRMLPHTEGCPKPMLEVLGKPMLQHTLERARDYGFTNFLITLHYLPNVIRNYFGDGSSFGVNIKYLEEREPLGTAGALSLIEELPTSPLIVLNGDVLCDIDLPKMISFHKKNVATATMAVRDHIYQNPFGVVELKGQEITGFNEKPVWRSYINAGIYILNPSVFELLKPNECFDMPDFFDKLRQLNYHTIAYHMQAEWMDVGNPTDLDNANRNWEK